MKSLFAILVIFLSISSMKCISEDLNFVSVNLLALKDGRQVKFAQCEINLGKMHTSIESLDYLGKDIVEYNPDHRAIRFYNCRIVNAEFTQNILQNVNGSNDFDLMYRFISSKATLASDVLLGESLTFSFRRGPDSSDFNANIVILFGNCKVGRKAQNKPNYMRISEQEVSFVSSVIFTLNDTHKKFLIEKLASTNANAKEFETFLRNYNNLKNSRDFDIEINTIKAQIDSKDKECSSKESTLNQNRSEHQKQLETLEELKKAFAREEANLRELNARRTTLEREQAEAHDLKRSHESRLEAMRQSRTRIEAALVAINAISSVFFSGCPACINDHGVDACCVNRVRGF